MILEDIKNDPWCNCGHNEGHSAGTLLDGTDLIICKKCKGMVMINGLNEFDWKKEQNV